MHLVSDYIHPYRSAGGHRARCRLRIFLPEEEQDAPVVICSELPNNGGTSVTPAAEQLAAEVIRSHGLPTPLVWIEHWPKETTNGGEETFELVVFSSYEVTKRAPYLGEGMARRRYLEEARPRYRGGIGGREGVERAINCIARQRFFPPQPVLLGAAERIYSSRHRLHQRTKHLIAS